MEKKNKTTKILMHDIPLRLIKVLNIICLTMPTCFALKSQKSKCNGQITRGWLIAQNVPV